jgi:hypothetical protein
VARCDKLIISSSTSTGDSYLLDDLTLIALKYGLNRLSVNLNGVPLII